MQKYLKELLKNFTLYAFKASFTAVIVVIVLIIGFGIIYRNQVSLNEAKTFSVQGEAKTKVVPDIIRITIGSIVEGTDVNLIQTTANEKINKALEKLKSLGIPENKIQTSSYDLIPQYDYNINKIKSYRVNISLLVEIENSKPQGEMAGKVINAGVESGLNEVRSLNFDLSNREEVMEELKLKAIENAKSKKDSLAKASGLRLGEVKNVVLGGNSGYYPPLYGNEGVASPDKAGTDNPTVNIKVGETELNTVVTIYYEII